MFSGSTSQPLPVDCEIEMVSYDHAENLEHELLEGHKVGVVHHRQNQDAQEAEEQEEYDGDGNQAGDVVAPGPSARVFQRPSVPLESFEVDSGSDISMFEYLTEDGHFREVAGERFMRAESRTSHEMVIADQPSNVSDWRKEEDRPLSPETDTVQLTMTSSPAKHVSHSNRCQADQLQLIRAEETVDILDSINSTSETLVEALPSSPILKMNSVIDAAVVDGEPVAEISVPVEQHIAGPKEGSNNINMEAEQDMTPQHDEDYAQADESDAYSLTEQVIAVSSAVDFGGAPSSEALDQAVIPGNEIEATNIAAESHGVSELIEAQSIQLPQSTPSHGELSGTTVSRPVSEPQIRSSSPLVSQVMTEAQLVEAFPPGISTNTALHPDLLDVDRSAPSTPGIILDSHIITHDVAMPTPFLLRDSEFNFNPDPSSIVVDTTSPAESASPPAHNALGRRLPDMPDPYLPPPDSMLPDPISTEDNEPNYHLVPSLVVEPPNDPPEPESVGEFFERAETPPALPDPHSEPPDSTTPAPILLETRDLTPTPSLIVEVPNDMPAVPLSTTISRESTVVPREETPIRMPDPHSAPPDAERIMPEIPHGIKSSSPASASIVAEHPEEPAGSVSQIESTKLAAEVDPKALAHRNEADRDSNEAYNYLNEAGTDSNANESEPITSRLRHRHGLLDRPRTPSPPSKREIRSQARQSTSPGLTPPVTRSHCFYRKLRISDEDSTAVILIPQCTLAEARRLDEGDWEDAGEPTAREEEEARPRALTDSHPLIHPALAIKLHRIVGKNIFDEGHCFLLRDSSTSLPAALEAAPAQGTPYNLRKRKLVDLEIPEDEEDVVIHVQTTPTASSAKRGRVAKRHMASGTQETAAARSQQRALTRSISRTGSMATDDASRDESPVLRAPSTGLDTASPVRRQTRASSAKKGLINEGRNIDMGREETPASTAQDTPRGKSGHDSDEETSKANIEREVIEAVHVSTASSISIRGIAESSQSPAYSTRKRKFRLSASKTDEGDPQRTIEAPEVDELEDENIETVASPSVRETRSTKRRAVPSPSAPDLPVSGGEGAEADLSVDMTIAETPRRPKKGILGRFLGWR